ncbi:MAG: hypothetical protein J7J86_02775 [Bacteroidales bacterium]|nr:hypothetical protein [Bacteroidales bacterium]
MKKVNKNNYEIYILDYYEGNLSDNQVDELMLFLAENPKLKEEFDNFENITLSPDMSIEFKDKDKLKKNIITPCNNINENNYENFFIADLEGDISSEKSENLKTFIEKNPCLKKEYETFKLTYLKPDESIVFENKKSLKKYPFKAYFKKHIYYSVSIAASILIVLYFFFNKPEKQNFSSRYEIAQINNRQYINTIKIEKQKPEIDILKTSIHINDENSILATTNPSVINDELKYRNSLKIENTNTSNINKIFIPVSDLARNNELIMFKRFEFIELLYFSDLHDEILLAEQKNQGRSKTLVKKGVNFLKKILNIKEKVLEKKSNNNILWVVAEFGVNSFSKITQEDIKLSHKTNKNGKTKSYSLIGDNIRIINSKK